MADGRREAEPESQWVLRPFQCVALPTENFSRCRLEPNGDGTYALAFGRSGLRCRIVDLDERGDPSRLRDCRFDESAGIVVPGEMELTENIHGWIEGTGEGWRTTDGSERWFRGVLLKQSWPRGPSESVASYCTERVERLRRSTDPPYCMQDWNDPDSRACDCRPAVGGDVRGPTRVDGVGPLAEAVVLVVARGSAEFVECELAMRTTRGVFVLQRMMTCDGMQRIDALGAERDGRGATVRIEWAGHGVTCRIDPSGLPICGWRQPIRAATE